MFNKISFLLIILTLLVSSCNLELKQNTISYEFFAGEKDLLYEAEMIKNELDLVVSLRVKEIPLKGIYQLRYESDREDEWVVDVENRKIKLIAQLKNNILEGKYYTYHQSGSTRSIGFYKNGKRHGDWMQFHTNGLQVNSGKYRNDQQFGEWFYYDTLKLFRERRNYINGNEYSFISYDSLDRMNQSGEYLNGIPNGKWREYDTLGVTLMELSYREGKYHDSLIIFEDGTMVAYQLYEYGKVIKEGLIDQK